MIDPNNITICLQTNFIGLCPPAQPMYNIETLMCEACPDGTAYQSSSNTCETEAEESDSTSSTEVAHEQAVTTSTCPPETPYLNITSN